MGTDQRVGTNQGLDIVLHMYLVSYKHETGSVCTVYSVFT